MPERRKNLNLGGMRVLFYFVRGRVVDGFLKYAVCCAVALTFWAAPAQSEESFLRDRNGDEEVIIDCFGDSITTGVGDGTAPGAFVEEAPVGQGSGGYPGRLSSLLGVPVASGGFAGEVLTTEGEERFPSFAAGGQADFIIILEGVNDAIFRTSADEVRRSLQRIINVARALEKEPLLVTILPPCCDRQALAQFTRSYNQSIRELGLVNQVHVVDGERMWDTLCPDLGSCSLYNRPEGLHPNSKGYDALAQTVAAVMLEIDPFSERAGNDLSDALGVDLDAVVLPAVVEAEEGGEEDA